MGYRTYLVTPSRQNRGHADQRDEVARVPARDRIDVRVGRRLSAQRGGVGQLRVAREADRR